MIIMNIIVINTNSDMVTDNPEKFFEIALIIVFITFSTNATSSNTYIINTLNIQYKHVNNEKG